MFVAAHIFHKVPQLVAQSSEHFVFVLDRF